MPSLLGIAGSLRIRASNKISLPHICDSEQSEESGDSRVSETLCGVYPRPKTMTQGDNQVISLESLGFSDGLNTIPVPRKTPRELHTLAATERLLD